MRVGLGILRLSPAALWSMTPRELAAALDGALGLVSGHDTMNRTTLARLMSRYPDS